MDYFLKIVLWLVVAEVSRRLLFVLIDGFTGPLTKLPGPFSARFTVLPWMIDVLGGEHHYKGDSHIAKYGKVVRIGEYVSEGLRSSLIVEGPNAIIFANTSAVRKILLELDLPKSLIYQKSRVHADIGTLFTERDKTKYKTSVRRSPALGYNLT